MAAERITCGTLRRLARHPWVRLAIAVLSASIAVFLLLLVMGSHSSWSHPVWAAATQRYVAPGGTDSSNDCRDSGNPCATVQHAVSQAAPGDQVLVAGGLYAGVSDPGSGTTQTVYISKTLILAGGYTLANWTAPDPRANPTILDAQGKGRVVYIAGSASPTVTGFIIQNGDAGDDSGGGIFVKIGAPLIVRNVISGNKGFYGGGVYNQDGSPRLEANIIRSNVANAGGGFLSDEGTVTALNNIFYGNSAHFGGGLANNISSTLTAQNDVFYGNIATKTGDTDGYGGGLINAGTAQLVNLIVFGNTAENLGGGIRNDDTGSMLVDYSDVVSNTAPAEPDYSGSGITQTNNLSADPLFVDAPGGDFHLQPGSPARDHGTFLSEVADDFDGEARPFGVAYDMGADEYYSDSTCFARLNDYQIYDALQAAVSDAGPDSLIKVAGYCTETVSVNKDITIRGGYTTTNWTTPRYRTVLDAQGGGRALSVTGPVTFTLENMHVTGGQVDGDGAGIYLGPDVIATLSNNVIYDNHAANGDGGGIYNAGGDTEILHNTIYGNTASGNGGGLYAGGSGLVTLRSSIIAGNSAASGGGLYGSSQSFALDYNDYYDNSPGGNFAGGVGLGPHDLTVDPGLREPSSGDFHLDFATSQVINRADPASPIVTDFEGDHRPQGTRADIGADESLWYADVILTDAPESPYIVTDTNQVAGKLITFNHTIRNAGQTGTPTDTFVIQTYNSDGWQINLVGISPTVVISAGISLPFQVVVEVDPGASGPINNQTLITATSQTSSAAWDSVVDLLVSAGVELLPSYNQNVDPGAVITYTHTLKNTGPATDTYTVHLVSDQVPPWGSTTVAWPFTATLGPDQAVQVTVVVTVPTSAEAGLAEHLNLVATSNTYPGVSAMVTDTTTANAIYGDRYVSTSGDDYRNNCHDLARPCRTIKRGLEQVTANSTLFVEQGVYQEHDLLVLKTITLQGGWYQAFTKRNLDPVATVIDAGQVGRALQVGGGVQPIIEYFTLQGGRSAGAGGGVYLEGTASPTLRYNIIRNNRAARDGGGVYNSAGLPVLYHNQVYGNQADMSGGGLYNSSGTLALSATQLYDNEAAQRGGALASAGGTLLVQNDFIYGNRAGDGGGIYVGGGVANIWHDSLYDNAATGSGGGILAASGTANIFNTIVFSHTGAGIYRSGGAVSQDYNDVYQNSGGDYVGLGPAPHNLAVDPLFIDPANGNLHLTLDSPAVDQGDPASAVGTDIDGDSRPANQGFDIGADELTGCLAKVVSSGTIYGILQEAVDAAGVGDTVQVSGYCWGVHPLDIGGQVLSQTLHIVKPLTVQGGWNQAFTQFAPEVYTTTLDARGLGRVALISGTTAVTLEYFHILNGDAAPAGGPDAGGGVYLSNTTATLRHSRISGSRASQGAGLYVTGGSPTVERSRIYENQANLAGGAVYISDAYLMLRNNFVYSNTASGEGGGVYNAAMTSTLLHNTFYGNLAGGNGGGAYNAGGAGFAIRSNVFAENQAVDGGAFYDAGGAFFDYNDIWANGGINQVWPVLTAHNMFQDPLFVNVSGADFHLSGASPLIDAGDPATDIAEANGDFDGDPRPGNQGFDIGADEQAGCYASISPYDPGHVYGSVQVAIDLAGVDDTVRVAGVCQGVHPLQIGAAVLQQTAHVTKNLTLQGGWTWDPDSRTLVNHNPLTPATLDAMQLGRVLLITDSATVSVEYFNIVNGDATGLGGGQGNLNAGGGVYNYDGALTLNNSSLFSNTAEAGGALYNAGGSLVLAIDSMDSNQADYGAAVYLAGGAQSLSFNSIYSNTAGVNGGALYIGGGDSVALSANMIRGNAAAGGAAIYQAAVGAVAIQNNMIYRNQASLHGGGFYNASGSPLVQHNTFYGNGADGLYLAGGAPVISNSLVINSAGVGVYVAGGAPAIAYNDVYANSGGEYGGLPDQTGTHGNISKDPLFADVASDDFHLRTGSPAVDAGDPASTLPEDFEHDIRPSSQGFDMGADEIGNCFARTTRVPGVIYGNPQQAVDASQEGDIIDIAGQCYGVHTFDPGGGPISQTLHINKSVIVHGGWRVESRGNPFAEYDPSQYTTLLDAIGLGRVLYLYGGVTAQPSISGFTLRNGDATLSGLGGGGGGIYNNSNARLLNLAVYSNTALNGGGFYNAGGAPTLEADSFGTNIIRHNSAAAGGGLYVAAGVPRIWNAIVRHNTATSGDGGGFYLAGGAASTVLNDTIFENGAADQGGGIYIAGGSHDVRNLIVAGNSAGDGGGIFAAGGTSDLAYNDVWGNTANNYGGISDQTGANGNISQDPLFADGAFHLLVTSPARDAGDPNSDRGMLGVDFEGDPRPSHQYFDMGADEFGGCLARLASAPDVHYGSVQLVVDLAAVTDTVQVAGYCRGVHSLDLGGGQIVSQTVHLNKGITLEGGWQFDPPFRTKDHIDYPTYLDAEAKGRVLYIYGSAAPTIRTVDLLNGDAASLGGGAGSENAGGCVYIADGQPDFTGGINIFNCNADQGGALYNVSSDFTMHNTGIFSNTAAAGGGFYNAGGAPEMQNLLYWNNAATADGGAIYVAGGSPELWHLTLAENMAGSDGGAIYNTENPLIRSSIFYFNMALNAGGGLYDEGSNHVDYSDWYLNLAVVTGTEQSNVFTGSHSLSLDPVFSSESGRAFALSEASPLIDASDLLTPPVLLDFELDPRPQINGYDMGWDEVPERRSFSLTPDHVLLADPCQVFSVTHSLNNLGNLADTYTVTLDSQVPDWGNALLPDDPLTIPLDGGQSAQLSFLIQVPCDALGGTQNVSILKATSHGAPTVSALATDKTTVNTIHGVEIAPTNYGAALPGQTVTYTHVVTNMGNVTDTFGVTLSPDYSYGQVTPATFVLGPGVTETITVGVTIEGWAAGGLTDIMDVVAYWVGNPNVQAAAADHTGIGYISGTRYVRTDGHDGDEGENTVKSNNCTDLSYGACRTIQHAVNQTSPGDEIWIGGGVYTDVVTATVGPGVVEQVVFLNKSVTLRGGYDVADWAQPPAPFTHTVTLGGQNARRAIYVPAGYTPTVEYLALANGVAAHGAGLYNAGSDLTLQGVALHHNQAGQDGGGLYSAGGNLFLQNNTLYRNQAAGDGGGLYVAGGNARLEHDTFHANQAGQSGGGLYNAAAMSVTNTILVSNTAGSGGAVFNTGTATLASNDIAFNDTPQVGGPASPNESGTLALNPRFRDTGGDDYHLAPGSPMINAGTTSVTTRVDFEGDERPLVGGYDIGADELLPMQALLFYDDETATVEAGAVVVFTHTLVNMGDFTDTITITYSSDYPWPIAFEQPVPYAVTLGLGEAHSLVLTVEVPLDANGLTNLITVDATSGLNPEVTASVQDRIDVKSAEWSIAKSVSPADRVQPGDYLTYTITVANIGDLPTSGLFTVTDALPEYTQFVSGTPQPDQTSPLLQWVSGITLTPGASLDFSYVVTVTRPLTHGIDIVNDIYWVTGGGAYTDAVGAPVVVSVEAPPSLAAAKTASAGLVRPGDYLTYTITISNAASALGPATGLVISDTLPEHVAFLSMGFVPPAGGTFTRTASLLEWQLSNPIQVGGSAQVTAAVRLTSPLASPLVLTNTYSITASGISTGLSGALTTDITSTNIISMAKTVDPVEVMPGQAVTYTITLTNSGDGVADVSLSDTLHSGFVPGSYFSTVMLPGRTWDTTEGTATVSFAATAPMTQGIYYNQAITATYGLSQVTLNDVAPVTVRSCWVRLNDDPTIYDTVQAAVDVSTSPSDVVKVAGYCAAVESRAGVTQTVYLSKTLIIQGGYTPAFGEPPDPAAHPATLDALGRGRVFYITGNISPIIAGLRITGGDAVGLVDGNESGGGLYVITATVALSTNHIFGNNAFYGGGLYLLQGAAVLRSNSVTTNTADYGGGICLEASDAVVSDNEIGHNAAYSAGGGAYLHTTAVTFRNNQVISNTTDFDGGGLYLYDSDAVLLDQNTISHNRSDNAGGGLYLENSDVLLSENDISANMASFTGGGVYLQASAAQLTENTITSNQAQGGQGGGIYLQNSSGAAFSSNLITSNSAGQEGGGLYFSQSAAALDANRILSNSAGQEGGGGLYLYLSDTVLTNTVIADNLAPGNGAGLYIHGSTSKLWHTTVASNSGATGVYVRQFSDEAVQVGSLAWLTNTIFATHTVGIEVTFGSTATLESTLWWANGTDTDGFGTIITGTRNFAGDPAFADPGAGDYHIRSGSAAIDEGLEAGVAADIDGEPRPAGAYPDLGADEFPAGLTINKEPDYQLVRAGSPVTFTIHVTNSGLISLTGVSVSDPSVSDCGRSLGNLEVGQPATYTCTLSSATDSFTNTASAAGLSTAGMVTGSDMAFVEVVTPAIHIAKVPDSPLVQSGDPVTFTMYITNTGDITLTGVVVDDPLVAGCDRALGSMASGVFTSYTCVISNVTAPLTNTAIVTGTPPVGEVVTDTATAFVDVISPDIAIAKVPDSPLVRVGDPVTFTISVTNTGNVDLDGVEVGDPLVADCDRVLDTMASGVFTSYTCAVNNVTAPLTNTAYVTGTPPVGGVVTDVATAFVDVISPAIRITKLPDSPLVQSGDPVTFTIRVTNTGDITLTDVVVDDPVVSACSRSLGDLASGVFTSYTCAVGSLTTPLTNTVIVTGTPPADGVVTDTATAFVDIVSAAVQIAKVPDSPLVQSGDSVTFTIRVTNTGDITLTDVVVDDLVVSACDRPLGDLASDVFTSYTCSSGSLTAPLANTVIVTGTPPVGEVVTDTATAFVDIISPSLGIAKLPDSPLVQSGDPVTFTIRVTNTGNVALDDVLVDDPLATDCNRTLDTMASGVFTSYTCVVNSVTTPLTNTAIVTGTPPVGGVVTDTATAFVDVISPAIRITKLPDSQVVAAGGMVTFTIYITNTGDVALGPVSVGDVIAPDCGNSWSSLDVGAGDVYSCTVTAGDLDFTNLAVATGVPPAGPEVTDSDAAFVDVVHPAIEIDKTPDNQVIASGSTATFTLYVTNTGDITLTGVTVSDILVPDCDWIPGTLTLGAGDSHVCSRNGVTTDFVNTAVISGLSLDVNQVVSDSDVATVTVQSPLVGLVAVNDSPTPLGGTTTLTATATPTTNVTYVWAFGDGSFGSGQTPTHVYPAVGVYSTVVTASNSVSWLTATTLVTITDVPIDGLAVTSSSPTPLGSATSFTATITAGSNVTYTWSFGDGDTGSGPLVSHTYAATGTYTVIVTATNSVSVVTDTIEVIVTEAPAGLALYLPIILKAYVAPPSPAPKPDLVVTELFVSSAAGGDYTLQATVRNQSSVPVTYGNNFYVNVYVDPPEPFATGQLPDPGITPAVRWGVQGSWFGAGQSRVLTANCQVSGSQFVCTWYDGGHSAVSLGDVSPHRFYGWADPYDPNPGDAVVGTVNESNEDNNYSTPLEVPIVGLGGSAVPQVNPANSPGPQPTPTNVP